MSGFLVDNPAFPSFITSIWTIGADGCSPPWLLSFILLTQPKNWSKQEGPETGILDLLALSLCADHLVPVERLSVQAQVSILQGRAQAKSCCISLQFPITLPRVCIRSPQRSPPTSQMSQAAMF